jgi:alpha-beta hydrolase superfamily lysophospholipase
MTKETISAALLDKLAWVGLEFVKPPISGLVLRFPGLGSTGMKNEADAMELEWGEAGLLTIAPYQDPWGWMNPRVLHFVDDLVEGICAHHQLDAGIPLLSTGGSMGGHAALLYSIKSRHPVDACMALWPVCDLPYHYTERADLPRTMHHAFGYEGDIETVLRENSPLHQVKELPDIPYLIVHGEKDQAVKKSSHSDPMVAAMRQRQLQIEYVERPRLGHGNPLDYATARRIVEFVLSRRRR